MYPYAVSKTALNMLTRTMAVELQEQGICVVAVSPGWVKTDMGGPEAQISVTESVEPLAETALHLTMTNTSGWLDRFGNFCKEAW